MHQPSNGRRPPRCVRLVIDAASAATLRQVVMRTCADAVRFLRIDACAGTGKVTALLCVAADAAPTVCQEIMRFLPDCECAL